MHICAKGYPNRIPNGREKGEQTDKQTNKQTNTHFHIYISRDLGSPICTALKLKYE